MKKVSYIDSNLFSPKDAWDALSMAEKSEMMKVAVQNGITNLEDIRREYNEFAGGGYMDKAKALIKKNEGWMAKPYKDAPEGKSWRSVGYGFNDSGFYDKYPEGISRHYENGITKAQAEQELSYILNKADKHLRSIYGKQWDNFNDNQKAAIMDTYYQRPASVGRKSAFYNAVKSGKDASKYLGVNGFADRNKKRQSVFGGGAVPMVADNIDTSLPQEVVLQPIVENIPEFIPLNPQAFNTTLPTYQRPELTFEEPVVQETPVSPYSPEEIERQERAEGLANLGRFLSFTNTSGSNNAFLNTIGMLTGNTFAEGGDTNDADLVDWIIREEGFNKKPEDIGDGKITLGSGLTDPKWHALYKKRGNKWSAEDNRMAVAEEVANRRRWAEKNIPNWNTLPDSAQKALLSYKYNYNFTSANSPKLFQALADSNLYEAAKQMDATSKDPKFKKGLMDRRKREQEWFLSDVTGNTTPTQAIPVQTPTTIGISIPSITEPAVSTAVRNNYVPATTTPYNRGNNMRRAFESAVAFNRMMDATSLQNNPLPEYQFPIEYADGGKIHIKPSHRGRLTELKKRTGKSEAELYKTGGPAVRKMITFARNARKWKHELGGNLYDDGGSYSYTKPLDNVIVDKYGNLLDLNVPSARGAVQLPEVIATTRDPRKPVPTTNYLNSIDSPATQIRNTLYRRILPISDYDIRSTLSGMMEGEFDYDIHKDPEFSYKEGYPKNTDYTAIGGIKAPLSVIDGIWAEYLQIPQKDRKKYAGPTIHQSKYMPSSGGRSDVNYYAIPLTKSARASVVNEGLGLPIGRNMVTTTLEDSGNTVYNLGQYTLGRGMDTKGDYISYYDVFDLNPFSDKYNGTDIPILNKLDDASFGIGKPVHIYDRIYLDDYYGMPKEYRGSSYLPELEVFKEKPYKIEATYRTVK